MMGTVKWFNETKGAGMIEDEDGSGHDIFVSASELIGTSRLEAGQRVSFELMTGAKGRQAVSVEVVG
jgi:cold shock protein